MTISSYLLPDNLRRPAPKQHRASLSQRSAVFYSYLPDWILTIILFCGFALLDHFVNGFKREFSLTDTSIQHTYAVHERIPIWLAVVIAIAVPFCIILFVSIVLSRSYWDAQSAVLGFLINLCLTWVIVVTVKVCVGRPRPDLIDRCQPESGATDAAIYGLSTYHICTQTDQSILDDGFKSFPSGHSAIGFSGLGYLSFYMAGKIHLFDGKGHVLKSWIFLAPLLAAALIAISRTMDYRHHATDVMTGSLIGIIIAFFSYRCYYPPLQDVQSHKPYSPRTTIVPTPESLDRETVPRPETFRRDDSMELGNRHHLPHQHAGDSLLPTYNNNHNNSITSPSQHPPHMPRASDDGYHSNQSSSIIDKNYHDASGSAELGYSHHAK